jgi:ParB family transcriptional regulator, chromosome partitioning protein
LSPNTQDFTDYVEQIDMNLVRRSHLLSLRGGLENTEPLMHSIREVGLLQPIVVRRTDDGFEIVAGYRRYESCRRLRWRKIPACITELSDKEAFEIALTENIQRKSLNPIQEADAFNRYVKEYGWGGVSELARRIGKSQEYVSQRILLLSLPEVVRQKIVSRTLSASAARELIWIKDADEQTRMAEFIEKNRMPTRAVRYMVSAARDAGDKTTRESEERGYAPGFERERESKEKVKPAINALDKTILSLRICMLRLDSILNGIGQDSSHMREFLMEHRRTIHKLIDDTVKAKVSLKGNVLAKDLVR